MDITVFGWKREHLKKYLNDCENICKYLAKKNNKIYTGGGGGFMLAANKGCYHVDPNLSFAVCVEILYMNEGKDNHFYPKNNLYLYKTFAERKDKLIMNKDMFIIFPGGIGTLDEFAELITLLKTNYINKKIPVILYGKDFWLTFKKWCESIAPDYYPEDHITKIIDSVEEFKELFQNLENN